ncbi:penicillin-binding protein, beta-lactamase class C [Polaromonas sp. CF318]|uniref:serine hydrolase domain-containing protein n=1 Tax=Polaromonas sp. CF318 TaxID=1144318 RepID=UPI000270F20A|nr:serine hydrolase [Polaromonas sp. CF318]EJL85113.1 penicillin-binding protein, beta-lactamase class C [Polaromonas sp. CF318]
MLNYLVPLFLCASLLLPSAAVAQAPAGEAPVYPGKSWETISSSALSPECHAQLDRARGYLQTLDTTSLMVVQQGRVLFSYGPTDLVSILFSARKSILSMLYGKYVADGTIDLEKSLADLGIDDVGGLLPIERQARLRHLLTARSGVYHPAANGGDDLAFAPARGSQVPGAYFLYNNWDFNAAGTVFESLTGKSIYRAFADELAAPLQLEDFHLERHRRSGDLTKAEHAAYHFFLSTRDMARLGYLMLQQGNWRGRALIPQRWVAETTAAVTPAVEMHPPRTARRHFGYGYLWWVLEEPSDSPLQGAYMAWGVHGQYILVVPKRQMVIAHKRQVPVAGNWNVSWVVPGDFLTAARTLAGAPCP